MKVRSLFIGLGLLSFAASASAGQSPSKQRLDAIWSAVDGRVSSQIDVWFEDGDYPKTIKLLGFQAAYSASDYDVVTNLGWMEENIEEWDAAEATYKDFLKSNPHDKDRGLALADFYFRRKNYKPIPALLEPQIHSKPHPNNFRILAHAYEKLNKYADAKRVWQIYVTTYPTDLSAKANLAKIEKKLASQK